MARYPMVDLPSRADIGQIAAWVTAPPVQDLVAAFGGPPPNGDLTKTLATLDAFSATVWDFRHGRERYLAEEVEFDPDVVQLVERACRALGMVDEGRPRRSAYTRMVVLGGLIRACLQRPAFAAQLLARGVAAREVVVLGSFRELSAIEVELAERLGMGTPITEDQAMDAGLRKAFGLGEPTAWAERVRTYRRGSLVLRTVAAPSGTAGRRADTADTYRYWAEHVTTLTPGDRVLAVTSSAYVPHQHCDALRILDLGYGCSVETVASAPSTVPFTTADYLQELRSALRSMRSLHARLVS